jgi:RimJ/RimL family protein N-acetyltransferase
MAIHFSTLSEVQALEIAGWCYPPPYDFYDGDAGEDGRRELLDPSSPYYGAVDDAGALIGFFCFGATAQVPGGYAAGAYDDPDALDLGLGMRPDLTGRNLGPAFVLAGLAFARATFAPATFRLSVAAFNLRAIRVYQRAGFVTAHTFVSRTSGGAHRFVVMTRPVDLPL